MTVRCHVVGVLCDNGCHAVGVLCDNEMSCCRCVV